MRRTTSLNGEAWRMGQVEQKAFGPVRDLSAIREWLPARVPGDVRLDLLAAGRISDPYFGMDNQASQWVDEFDWWYTREIEMPRTSGSDRRFLVFDGIDYQSAIFFNDVELGRHTGMFSRQVYEIPRELWAAQSRLAVRVWGSNALPAFRLGLHEKLIQSVAGRFMPYLVPFADRLPTLKTQMGFGWDFAPRIRTCGIWEDVALIETNGVLIRDLWAQGVPDGRVNIILQLDADRMRDATARIRVHGKNFESETQEFTYPLATESGKVEFTIKIEDPRLWNPWDRGEPNLYALELELADESGVLDSAEATFGLRTIDLAPNPGSAKDEAPWTFVVNGIPEFVRGANWVPADALPGRLTREDYAPLIRAAREANVNLLRVWGGGLREKQAFYDLCDEHGLLIWQEFPFSGAPLDHLRRDADFLDFVRQECGAIVRAVRQHPSLALWCGGNEYNTLTNAPLVRTLREVVATEDGTRPFKPGSPSSGEHHNWRVWHWKANTREYRQDEAGFMGEFGLQSPPAADALSLFLPEAALWPPGAMWVYHNAELEKLWRYARGVSRQIDSLDSFIEASQQAQQRGLQVMIEHARRNKGRTSGCAFWQLNEPWPSICWSVLPYRGAPKAAYHKIRQLYNPVLVSLYYPLQKRAAGQRVEGVLWLINDTLEPVHGFLRIQLNGQVIETRTVSLGADRAAPVGEIGIVLGDGANALELELAEGVRVISTNEYDLNYSDEGEIVPLASPVQRLAARLQS